jgi:hypothetical protein
MAPSNPKTPSRRPAPRSRPHTEELPFDDELPQPRLARRKKAEEVIPTALYDIGEDAPLPQKWGSEAVSDPGFKPAYLYVEKGPGQGQLLPVNQGTLVIGRASVSELRLQHSSVSRRHAQLTRLADRFYLKDLGSQNGTFANKARIETEIEVYPGDLIAIGSARLKLRGGTDKLSPDVQRQIRKLADGKQRATSAGRSRSKTAASNLAAVAVACLAIGFGLAAVAFAALKFLEASEADGGGLVVEASAPVVGTSQEPSPAEAAPTPAAVGPAPAKAAVQAPRPEPRPATRIAERRTGPAPTPAPKKAAAAPAPTKVSSEAAAALVRYEEGDVAGAVAMARAAGDKELLAKLSEFQRAWNAAQAAEKAGEGTKAIRSYQQALAVDEKLSGGWGKHGPVISKKLGGLYTLVGQYYVDQGDEKNARLALNAALRYQPDNAEARAELNTLAQLKAKPAPAPAPTRAPASRTEASSREQQKSAIEDAWND